MINGTIVYTPKTQYLYKKSGKDTKGNDLGRVIMVDKHVHADKQWMLHGYYADTGDVVAVSGYDCERVKETRVYKQSEIRDILKNINPAFRRSLRTRVVSKSYRRADGCLIMLTVKGHIVVNIDCDEYFELSENNITYTFKNKKCCVTIWKAKGVPPQVVIY